MMSLNYLTVYVKFQIFKIILSEYIEYIAKHETLQTNPPIHNYINWIKNRLAFKIKDRYILELQTPGIIKLLGSKEKITNKTKN